ncbi:MAG: hypothetical protein MUF37_00165, partial [Methanoregulaceae archaeon]|nr:hypothetical protein [Methanoregulaceae archaeon]
MGFELFTSMMKEEWRLHSTMFGSISFALFPVLIFGIVFMSSFLLPLFRAVLTAGDLALITTGVFLLLGVMVGGFGLLGNEVMNRRFGQMSLLAYSARSLPLSERYIFTNFVVKDIVYYLFLWVLPFVLGFAVASPFIGVPSLYPLLLFAGLTLTFLFGLSAIFFLSTVYSRSKLALAVIFTIFLAIAGWAYLVYGAGIADLFPPLQLLYNGSWISLVESCVLVAVPFVVSIVLFTPEYTGISKRFSNILSPIIEKLSFFPTPPLAAKDLVDLWRSGGGVGQILFSFLLPLGLIWFFLSVLRALVPDYAVLLVFAVTTGIISATMYTWITSFDTFSSYACLPVSVSTLITSKICTFTVLQVIPAVFIVVVTIVTGGIMYLIPALVIWGAVSFYALSVSIYLTGLTPNVLVYDVKVLLAFMILVGVPVMIVIALTFINPYLGIAALLLGIPAYGLVRKGYKRWEGKD